MCVRQATTSAQLHARAHGMQVGCQMSGMEPRRSVDEVSTEHHWPQRTQRRPVCPPSWNHTRPPWGSPSGHCFRTLSREGRGWGGRRSNTILMRPVAPPAPSASGRPMMASQAPLRWCQGCTDHR